MSVNMVIEAMKAKFGEPKLQHSTDDYLKDLACDLLVDLHLSVMREVTPEGLIRHAELDITESEAARLAQLLDTAHIEMEVSWPLRADASKIASRSVTAGSPEPVYENYPTQSMLPGVGE